MGNIRKPTVRYSHLLITLALLGRLCAAELAQAESFACADIIRGVREKMEVSIEEGSPRDALEVLVALSPFIKVACDPKAGKKEQSNALSPGGSSAPPPPVVVEPTATPALGPSVACKDAKKEVEEMQLALESTKNQLMLLNEDIKLKQAEWEKNKKPVDILKDKILMTKRLYQRALERVLRVGPKWEDILHVYQSSGVAWSRWVTRYPKLGEWIRTVQKFEDLLFDLYKDVASLLAAQNVLARDLINKKEISKTTLREVNRLSNILKRLLDKMQLACR